MVIGLYVYLYSIQEAKCFKCSLNFAPLPLAAVRGGQIFFGALEFNLAQYLLNFLLKINTKIWKMFLEHLLENVW